ncbi:MAG TPA: NAD-dependent epimerase/dehydratase family protein [Ktedonobacteraceae bacterium]|nr:NAD-dependent epimerase/dehydratase family protein [Ktedonobacteraceae bacterium]
MRILVIGGTRFIGLATVRLLHEQGHDIAVFHRGQTQSDVPVGVQHILGDRAQIQTFKQEFERFAPELVLDIFPFVEQDARTVMNLFKGMVRRIVAISSQDVYRAYGRLLRTEPGPTDPVPLTEDSPLREKLYPYRGTTMRASEDKQRWMDDYDKIPIERIIMSDPALPGTILRLPMVYGPGDGQHRLFEYLKRMDDKRPAIILDASVASWRWTRGYVENVAAAIVLAITNERAAGRIYNVGEARTLTLAEWVRAIANAVGWSGKIVTVPSDHLPPHLVADMDTAQDLLVDTTRIRQALGYHESINLGEALTRTIFWERANPPAEVDSQQFDYATEDTILARES